MSVYLWAVVSTHTRKMATLHSLAGMEYCDATSSDSGPVDKVYIKDPIVASCHTPLIIIFGKSDWLL